MPTNQQEDPNQMTLSSKESAVEVIGTLGMMAAYAIGLFAVLFLVFQVPDIYNSTLKDYDTALLPIVEQDTFAKMGEFIRRIGLEASDPEAIRMGVGAPWMVFLLLVAGAGLILTKTAVRLIERVLLGKDDGQE